MESLAATYHDNKTDVWLVAHDFFGKNYISYLITYEGIDTVPIISETGTYNDYIYGSLGSMKISNNGEKIALHTAYNFADSLDISFFDSNTGIISNTISIAEGGDGLEFSPDNNKLYNSRYALLEQYDLTYWNADSVFNSKVILISGSPSDLSIHGPQIAPDGKIYIARYGQSYLSVINNPNTAGEACDFVLDGVYLNGKTSDMVLPNFISSYFDFSTGLSNLQIAKEEFKLFPNPASTELKVSTSLRGTKQSYQLNMYNLYGSKVKTLELNSTTKSIDVSNLPVGVYIYKISTEKETLQSDKLMIVR